MADIVTPEKRSRMMAGIKGKNTKPEVLIRSALHKKGFRFRVHSTNLPGKPDIVLPKYNAIIFVNGCFWHGHNCHLFKWPSTREDFWKNKIQRNQCNEHTYRESLSSKGWRVMIIWECAIKGKTRLDFNDMIESASSWIKSDIQNYEIKGLS